MKYSLLAVLLVLFALGCHEELPEIEPVILHESDSPLFKVDSMSVLSFTPELKIRVYFSSRYEELTEQQKTTIFGAKITRNGVEVHQESFVGTPFYPADTIFFFDDIITETVVTCYDIFFRDSGVDSRSTELCVDMRPGVVIPQMEVAVASFIYNYSDNIKTLQIKNPGFTPFTWNLSSGASFLQPNILNGILNEGETVDITLEVDRSDLFTQDYDVELLLENDLGETIIISVEIHNYREEKWLISGRIIDAEYDKNNEEIIVVSNFPNEIRKFDPLTNSIESLNLDNTPNCISISQDGQFAAVGHSEGFYYINLSSMTLVENYTEIGNTFDIVLAPNNWAYLFLEVPGSGSEKIQCVNLENGEVFESLGLTPHEETKAKLHPSGDYIYAVEPISPTGIIKFDITGGVAQYLYEGPRTLSNNLYDIWISDDGNKIFLNDKTIFSSSSMQSEDISLLGELENEANRLGTVDCSDNKIFTISLPGNFEVRSNKIRMYQKDDLSFIDEVIMPDFLYNDNLNGKLFASQGYHGFFNSDGTKYYVLATWRRGSSDPSNEWAIITIDAE